MTVPDIAPPEFRRPVPEQDEWVARAASDRSARELRTVADALVIASQDKRIADAVRDVARGRRLTIDETYALAQRCQAVGLLHVEDGRYRRAGGR